MKKKRCAICGNSISIFMRWRNSTDKLCSKCHVSQSYVLHKLIKVAKA